MKLSILLLISIMFCGSASGQSIINGIVRSANDSLPIAGATIQIKGTRLSTNTNMNGRFSIAIKGKSGTLIVSHVSFQSTQQEFTASRDTFIAIVLQQLTNELQAVTVSTGYQTLPRERATGSFNQVDRKQLDLQVSPDVLSRLEASANGLFVDRGTSSTPQITIRGLSTIRGPKSPLIVVDNFPYDGDINNINPNDVESVTILKDAAASSIWGARAANGVIVITTKKGRFSQPVSIDLNAFVSVVNKPDLSYIRQMSSADFIDVEQFLYGKGYYNSWINSSNHRVLSDVVETLVKRDKGQLTTQAAAVQIDALRSRDVRDDLNKYVYQRPTAQQYALALRGGSENISWNASVGYDQGVSNLDALDKRFSLRYQQTYQPYRTLQVLTGMTYTRSDQQSGKSGYGSITQFGNSLLPYTRLADDNGTPLAIPRNISMSYLESAGNGKLLDWKYYPLEDYRNNSNALLRQDILLNTALIQQLPLGLTADVRYQYERQTSDGTNLQGSNSYYARDLVNSFTQINASGLVTNIIPKGGILDRSYETLWSHNFRGQLNFNRDFGKHQISALAGGELRKNQTGSTSNRYYGYNEDILTFGTVDYRNGYPNFITGSTMYIPDNSGINGVNTNYVSTFANAAYTYDQRYIVSASARRDASNLFGLKTNDQWNPFWSAGLSWIASNERFYKSDLVPYLKLRLTYGFSGNIDPSMSAVTTIQYAEASPYTGTPYSRFINYYNPGLQWETSKMLNFGVDFKTKGNRISGSIEYYQKRGSNLFGTAVIDYTSGIGNTLVKNVAAMSGRGLDVQLNTLNTTGLLKWSSAINFSFYRDKVTDYFLSSKQGSSFIGSNVPISGVVGKPVYSIFAYKWAGLDPSNGDPQGYINGTVSKNYSQLTGATTQVSDLTYFGSALPTSFGSFGNTFTYRQASLNFSMVYKFGYYFRRSSIAYKALFANWTGHSDYSLRWQKPGDETVTNVPSMTYPAASNRDAFYNGSEVLVEKGDHVRLQYVNLSYDFVNHHGRKLPFKSIQVYLNAANLGILWRANKQGIDPDYNRSNFITPSTYSIGIRANIR